MKVRLTRRLVLEERARAADGAGGYGGDWTALGEHWAHVAPARGRLERGDEFARSRVPLRIIVRAAPHGAPSRPSAGQRFREGERVFPIRAVFETGSSGSYLTCFADEETGA